MDQTTLLTVLKDNVQYGPYDLATIQKMLADRLITLDDFVWHEGLAEWTKLGDVLSVAPLTILRPGRATGDGVRKESFKMPRIFEMIGDSIAYPVRGWGWIMIFLAAVTWTIIGFVGSFGIIGLFASIFGVGYFGSFYLSIVSSTTEGKNEIPDFPSFTSFGDDIFGPFLRIVGLIIFSFLPAIAILIFGDKEAHWFYFAALGAVLAGCFYFPMAVLAVVAYDGIAAALPHIVLPAIIRCLPSYVLAVVILVVVLVTTGLAEEFAGRLPYIGWFLAALMGMYGMLFQGRFIGLIYNSKREAIRWE